MGSSRRSLWGVMGDGDSWHVYVTVIYCIRMEHGKRFSIRFPLDLLETLKKLAQEDKRSINGEIVWILSEYVKHRKGAKKS